MKPINRRSFLRRTGLSLGAGALMPPVSFSSEINSDVSSWSGVREQFLLEKGKTHMAQMLLASHPRQVREAVELHRNKFDENPTEYWEKNWVDMENRVLKSASLYLDTDPQQIVLTDSTTEGLGILYSGLRLKSGDHILTTTHDHYSTEKSLEYAVEKNGATISRVNLYDEGSSATKEEMVDRLVNGIKDNTRIVALTWVHSCTGVRTPVPEMASAIRDINSKRDASDRIFLCVDGVHGFGVENITMEEMGCDFFVAGTHKWLFGPRGTGLLWAKKDAFDMLVPTIPAFRYSTYGNWLGLVPEDQIGFSDLNSPGGFHAFEHRWALNEAFDFHMTVGKERIQNRTRKLNNMLKENLEKMDHVKLHTPVDDQISSGINCFEVEGMEPPEVVEKLHEHNVIASTSPYRVSYARLTPCVINTEQEVEKCIEVLNTMKA